MLFILEERSRLYEGLYDSHSERRPARPSSTTIKLLNPDLIDGDATSRRFALLEID